MIKVILLQCSHVVIMSSANCFLHHVNTVCRTELTNLAEYMQNIVSVITLYWPSCSEWNFYPWLYIKMSPQLASHSSQWCVFFFQGRCRRIIAVMVDNCCDTEVLFNLWRWLRVKRTKHFAYLFLNVVGWASSQCYDYCYAEENTFVWLFFFFKSMPIQILIITALQCRHENFNDILMSISCRWPMHLLPLLFLW